MKSGLGHRGLTPLVLHCFVGLGCYVWFGTSRLDSFGAALLWWFGRCEEWFGTSRLDPFGAALLWVWGVMSGLGRQSLTPLVLHCLGVWALCRLVWDNVDPFGAAGHCEDWFGTSRLDPFGAALLWVLGVMSTGLGHQGLTPFGAALLWGFGRYVDWCGTARLDPRLGLDVPNQSTEHPKPKAMQHQSGSCLDVPNQSSERLEQCSTKEVKPRCPKPLHTTPKPAKQCSTFWVTPNTKQCSTKGVKDRCPNAQQHQGFWAL